MCQVTTYNASSSPLSTHSNPLHFKHTLTILAKSPYPNGIYTCDKCKNIDEGFLYHYFVYEFDLESGCAFHPKLTSKIDISGGKKILDNAFQKRDVISKEEKKVMGETGKLDAILDKKRKVEGFEEYSKEEFEHYVDSFIKKYREDILGDISKSKRKRIDTIQGKQQFQKPELVFIGPYHRNEEHQLDKYKHSFLEKLISQTRNNLERDLCFYVGEFIALEKRARAYYSEDLAMSSRDFVKMMLVDGYFTIELLRHYGGREDDLF
ncbi:hypothetical protein REPUB_Repub18cG0065600 [Reevesia pubescens]